MSLTIERRATDHVAAARRAAADVLERSGRHLDSGIVRRGGGDDFAEVQAALKAVSAASAQVARLERALRCYADETFWEAVAHGDSLAAHDAGEIARAALSGKEMFQQHRD